MAPSLREERAAATLGTLAPALDAARIALAQALKAADEFTAFTRLRSVRPAIAILLAAGLAALVRPLGERPLAGYASIALLLAGTLLLLPGAVVSAGVVVIRTPSFHAPARRVV